MDKIYFTRSIEARLLQLATYFPAIVLTGPRQIGKTSLVQALRNQLSQQSLYLDLERPADLSAISNLEAFTEQYPEALIIFDEVQRKPSLFPELRSIIDRNRRPGRFLLLGSASFDLIRDTSETLAGRIALEELTGLSLVEASSKTNFTTHWLRGGYPDSLLAPNEELSLLWRENMIRTYLERDLLGFESKISPTLMRRVLTMLAHHTGQMLNWQSLAKSLQIDHRTLERYVTLLEQTFVVRRLPAYAANLGKRLVKTPKIYIRDTGLLHALLTIPGYLALSSHPIFGASFESYVIEQLYNYVRISRLEMHYFRTSNGNEIDIVLLRAGQVHSVIEIKTSPHPKLTKGFYIAREDLGSPPAYVVCPTDLKPYELNDGIMVVGPAFLPHIFNAK